MAGLALNPDLFPQPALFNAGNMVQRGGASSSAVCGNGGDAGVAVLRSGAVGARAFLGIAQCGMCSDLVWGHVLCGVVHAQTPSGALVVVLLPNCSQLLQKGGGRMS